MFQWSEGGATEATPVLATVEVDAVRPEKGNDCEHDHNPEKDGEAACPTASVPTAHKEAKQEPPHARLLFKKGKKERNLSWVYQKTSILFAPANFWHAL